MNENKYFYILIDKLKLQKKNIEKYKKMLNYMKIYTIYYITKFYRNNIYLIILK